MLSTYNGLAHRMPKSKPRPRAAIALRNRRDELGLNQDEIAEAMGELISQSAVSDLETGRTDLTRLETRRLVALARALKWTLEDLQRETGIDLAIKPGSNDVIRSDGRMVLAYDLASASKPIDPSERDGVPHWVRSEHDRPGLEVFIVRGSSMQPTFFDGWAAYCDTRDLTLQDGKIFVLRIHGDGICIKRARLTKSGWILTSDNPEHSSFVADEATVLGRVYFRVPNGDGL